MKTNNSPKINNTNSSLHSIAHDKAVIIETVNSILKSHFEIYSKKAHKLHPRFGGLVDVMHAFILSGGKRARPYLLVHTYQSYGGTSFADACRVGAGLELLHTAMLMHDDIIDRDYTRYGVKNIAGYYQEAYNALSANTNNNKHLADGAALLAGDINITAAFELFLSSGFDAETKVAATRLLAEACFRVTGGELIDTDSALYPPEDTDPLVVTEIKTAHYSFVTPLVIGASLANAHEDELAKLEELGMKLGVAFQLTDDILGVFGDEQITGKTVIGDIREGKQTHLYHLARKQASKEDKALLLHYYGNEEVDAAGAREVRAIFERSGARAACEATVQTYALAAQKIVDQLAISAASKRVYSQFIESMTQRAF
jgi:geranylgeranyl diphosphate synthase type II